MSPDEFDAFLSEVLLRLAEKGTPAAVWSAGCAAGEEPYSLRIAWEELPGKKPPLRLLATDIDAVSLERAAAGRYPESSLREVPDALRRKYFGREGESYRVREEVRRSVSFRKMDLLRDGSPGRFGLILCRNAAFTYFGPDQRVSVAAMLGASLKDIQAPGGFPGLARISGGPKSGAGFPHRAVGRAGLPAVVPMSRTSRSLGPPDWSWRTFRSPRYRPRISPAMASSRVAVEKSYRAYPPLSRISTRPSHPVCRIFSGVSTPCRANSLQVESAALVGILAPISLAARNQRKVCARSGPERSIPSSREYMPPRISISRIGDAVVPTKGPHW